MLQWSLRLCYNYTDFDRACNPNKSSNKEHTVRVMHLSHMNNRCLSRIESLETIYLKIQFLHGKVYLKILRREVNWWVFITWLKQFLLTSFTWLSSRITFISFYPQGGLAKITHGQPDGMFTLLNDIIFLFVCLRFFFFMKKNWKSNHSKLQLMRFVHFTHHFTLAQTTTMVLY